VTRVRPETSASSAVAALSVAVAMAGHVLAGGSMPVAMVPQLITLAAACWLLGEYLAGRRWLSLGVLAAVQLIVHLTLTAEHDPTTGPLSASSTIGLPAAGSSSPGGHLHDPTAMSMPMSEPMTSPMDPLGAATGASLQPSAHGAMTDAVTMTAAHLASLLLALALLGRLHHWVRRLRRLLARLVPDLPAAVTQVPYADRPRIGVPVLVPMGERWIPSDVSRRGPPRVPANTASS
jgi:hypothetical protein